MVCDGPPERGQIMFRMALAEENGEVRAALRVNGIAAERSGAECAPSAQQYFIGRCLHTRSHAESCRRGVRRRVGVDPGSRLDEQRSGGTERGIDCAQMRSGVRIVGDFRGSGEGPCDRDRGTVPHRGDAGAALPKTGPRDIIARPADGLCTGGRPTGP